jgi:hypothetical protein
LSDFEFRNLRTKTHRKLGLLNPFAVVGDESGNVFHPYIPGDVWVRPLTQNGYGKAFRVLGPIGTSVQLTPNTPVLLKDTNRGRLQIETLDAVAGAINGTDLLAANTPKPDSGGFVGQQSIITALVMPQAIPDMTVSVKAWLSATGGVYTEFPGSGSLDFTSPTDYRASAGNNRYAVVFMKEDFATLAIAASTQRSLADAPLGAADVQECITAAPINAVPLAVIRLYGGQTTILNSDIISDLRQMINTDPGEYLSTVSTTDATVTTLFVLTMPATTTVAIHGYVTARRTGGSGGTAEDGAYYERVVAVKNVAGTATIIGAVGTPETIEDQAGWDATFDVTGATVRCRITGAVNNNIDWKGTFAVKQVS